jgi:alpha-aminoadipic semialdehyde synthase
MEGLPPVPTSAQAPIDLLSTLLGAQLAYGPSERDAVILHHELCTKSASTGQTELFTSTLVQYGTENDSAMATTVGVVSRVAQAA